MSKELKEMENIFQSVSHSHVKHFPLYQGMDLYFFETKTDVISMRHPKLAHIMEINYCRSGRLGWKMGSGNQLYLGPGDFSLHTLDACAHSDICFPTGIYEGMTLCIDLNELDNHLPELLAGTGISREMFEEKFLKNSPFASFAGNTETDFIFSAFYGQPEGLELAYQKLKSLELLLYLSKMEPEQNGRLTEYQSEQVEIVREIHRHLTKNIGQRVTIEALSQQYLINPTTLKAVFKSVYGNSIAAHIKEHRMKQAAKMLRESNKSIAEIAQAVGYDSQGKFTAAFKSFFKILPSEYRKKQPDPDQT